METWYKKLGYYQNPFILPVTKDKISLIGKEEELSKAIYYVNSGSLVFVEGVKGVGKTKFLHGIIKQFKGRIIYVDADKLTRTINVEDLLRKRNGAVKAALRSKPKDMILLLDNVDELSPVNYERIKYYYDQGFLQSVVFTGEKFDKVEFSESIKSRISSRVINLVGLTQEEAFEMAAKRLDEDLEDEDSLITNDQLKTVFTSSKKNPRLFLINLHRVFEEMAYEEADKIDDKHLDILKDKLDAEDIFEYAIALGADGLKKGLFDDKGNSILKVGEYYRRPAFDMFCGNCGAIVTDDHAQCPECGAEFETGGEQQ